MINKLKIAAFLPVKANSKRIANKNIKLLAGKPLFLHALEKLIKCDFIDEVFLDSESSEIFELAQGLDFKKFVRDKTLADNSTDGNKLFLNEIKDTKADICIQILCTSPFIKPETIKKGLEFLAATNDFDSVIFVNREKQYSWNPKTLKPNYDIDNIPNSFNMPDTIVETMGLYIINREAAFKTGRRIGDKPYFMEISQVESLDINYPEDFELAELIIRGAKEKETLFFRQLSSKVNSSMISDILDELNIKNKIITGLKLNLKNKKIFGRAKTLKISKKTECCESNIYDALKSYETVISGDIIVVENEIPEFAYFGSINANLAIRSGAIGAIIGGKTRDSAEIRNLDFPVFSRGLSCKDIKNEGTVASINKKISINSVEIYPDDLIFADNEGIVIIPKKFEDIIIKKCFEIVDRENKILIDISKGKEVYSLRQEYGDF